MTMASTSRYTLDDEPCRGTRSIRLSDFEIQSTKLPILTIPESDQASTELDLALPEIIFGNNRLSIKHAPSQFSLEWNTIDMLGAVRKGHGWDEAPKSGAVRVAHAEEWSRGQSSTNSTAQMKIVKPFDWTYTTLHPGTTSLPCSTSDSNPGWTDAPPTHPGIPLALLARTDVPILFFDEVPLFEDELGDNGIADVTIRVRVNSTSFYVLARYALRIDHVLFRHYDVRVYHEFGSGEIVRELKGRQSSYDRVKSRLLSSSPSPSPSTSTLTTPRSFTNAGGGGGGGRTIPNLNYPSVSIPSRTPPLPTTSATTKTTAARRSPSASLDRHHHPSPTRPTTSFSASASSSSQRLMTPEDLTKLTDPNWVASVLEQIALEQDLDSYNPLGTRGSVKEERGEGEGRQGGDWEGLGKKLQVLRVPWGSS